MGHSVDLRMQGYKFPMVDTLYTPDKYCPYFMTLVENVVLFSMTFANC